jgi:predicted Na+-dependent transporter
MGSTRKPAEIAAGINSFLERAMPVLTPVGLAVGVLFPPVLIRLRPYIPLIFGVMTFSGALKLTVRDLGAAVHRPLPVAFFFLTSRIIMPAAVFLFCTIFFGKDTDTISGFVLIYAAPTAVSGFMWSAMFRGDPALSLALILIDTLIAPLAVPATVRLLLGTSVVMDTGGMALSLMLMVVVPTVIGVALNEFSRGGLPRRAGPYLNPLGKICLITVVAANSAAVAPQIRADNPRLWIIGGVSIFLSVLGFAAGRAAALLGRFSREKQVSFFFGVGLHNTSAAMTLGLEFFPGPAALPSVLGIMFQQSIAAVAGKIMLKKPGKKELLPSPGTD